MILNQQVCPAALLPFLTSLAHFIAVKFGYIPVIIKAAENAEQLLCHASEETDIEKLNKRREKAKLWPIRFHRRSAKKEWMPVIDGSGITFTLNFHNSIANKERITTDLEGDPLEAIMKFVKTKGAGLHIDHLDNGAYSVFYLGTELPTPKKSEPVKSETEPANEPS